MKITELYSTPIYSSRVSNYREIQEELQNSYSKKEFSMRSDWGATHYLSDISFNENLFDDPDITVFQQEIHKHIAEYLNAIEFYKSNTYRHNIKYKICSSWFAEFRKGCYAHIHNHGHCDIAGVYYFKVPENSADFFVMSTVPQMYSSLLFHHLSYRTIFPPSQGNLLLMPGWMDHGVQMNDTDEPRISVAFNVVFQRPELIDD